MLMPRRARSPRAEAAQTAHPREAPIRAVPQRAEMKQTFLQRMVRITMLPQKAIRSSLATPQMRIQHRVPGTLLQRTETRASQIQIAAILPDRIRARMDRTAAMLPAQMMDRPAPMTAAAVRLREALLQSRIQMPDQTLTPIPIPIQILAQGSRRIQLRLFLIQITAVPIQLTTVPRVQTQTAVLLLPRILALPGFVPFPLMSLGTRPSATGE